jgi:hypothetical protein
MTLRVPDVGEVRLLEIALGVVAQEDQILKLYKNNYTPVEGSAAGSFTEATWSGYAAAPLLGAYWSVVTVVYGVTTASYAEQTFVSDTDQTAQLNYGYFIIGASSGVLLWAERFTDGPYSISVNGDEIRITPKITGE